MFRDGSTNQAELRDYLMVIRHRRWTIAFAVAVVVGAALTAAFLQRPVYEGKAELLLQLRAAETLFDPNTRQLGDPARAVQTEIQVLRSQPIRKAVEDRLKIKDPEVSVSGIGQTDVVQVRARSTDPERAAQTANAHAEAYVQFKLTQAVNDVVAAVEQIQGKVTDLQTQISELDKPVSQLPASQRPTVEPNLRAQQDALIQQQAVFKQKLDELQVEKSLKTGGAQIVTSAVTPDSPVAPRPLRSGLLAAVLGLFFGTGLAFLFEYLDDSIKSKEDVDRVVPEIPVLGLVPAVQAWRERDKPQIISISDPASAAECWSAATSSGTSARSMPAPAAAFRSPSRSTPRRAEPSTIITTPLKPTAWRRFRDRPFRPR